ncbi:MAG TPA: 50S ribosomal protein L25 [Terriglobales bacterium]|nr:50S ribosomal protein L25 [Terriglobales bacterium]
MAIAISLAADPRSTSGKGPARQMRRAGRIPATLYGAMREPVSLTLDPKQVNQILHSESGHNTIFNLNVAGGETTAAMVVDWQLEPLRGRLLHVDLKRIALDQLIRVRIPVQTQGEATGVKLQGGILEVVTREVEIECLPTDIPEHIVVDVSELSIGQNLRVGDLKLEGNRRILTDADRVIAHVVAVKEVVEAAPAAEAVAGAPSEPEVIKKGKAEAEEGAEKEAGGKEKEKEKKK